MSRSAGNPPFTRARGFTLVELLIAVLVLGVLSAVALPAFFDTLRKGRRADAVAALSQVQQAQERFRANSASYATTLGPLGLAGLGTRTSGGHYSVAIDSASATGYSLTATPLAGSPQLQDSACQRLRVVMNAGNLSYLAACAGCDTFTASSRCWSQ